MCSFMVKTTRKKLYLQSYAPARKMHVIFGFFVQAGHYLFFNNGELAGKGTNNLLQAFGKQRMYKYKCRGQSIPHASKMSRYWKPTKPDKGNMTTWRQEAWSGSGPGVWSCASCAAVQKRFRLGREQEIIPRSRSQHLFLFYYLFFVTTEKETNSSSCKGQRSATKRRREKEGAEAEQPGRCFKLWAKWMDEVGWVIRTRCWVGPWAHDDLRRFDQTNGIILEINGVAAVHWQDGCTLSFNRHKHEFYWHAFKLYAGIMTWWHFSSQMFIWWNQ